MQLKPEKVIQNSEESQCGRCTKLAKELWYVDGLSYTQHCRECLEDLADFPEQDEWYGGLKFFAKSIKYPPLAKQIEFIRKSSTQEKHMVVNVVTNTGENLYNVVYPIEVVFRGPYRCHSFQKLPKVISRLEAVE